MWISAFFSVTKYKIKKAKKQQEMVWNNKKQQEKDGVILSLKFHLITDEDGTMATNHI